MKNLFKALLLSLIVTCVGAMHSAFADQRHQALTRQSHAPKKQVTQASNLLKLCYIPGTSNSVQALCRKGVPVNDHRYSFIDTGPARGFGDRYALATIFPSRLAVYLDLLTGEESASYDYLSELKRGPDGQLYGMASPKAATGIFLREWETCRVNAPRFDKTSDCEHQAKWNKDAINLTLIIVLISIVILLVLWVLMTAFREPDFISIGPDLRWDRKARRLSIYGTTYPDNAELRFLVEGYIGEDSSASLEISDGNLALWGVARVTESALVEQFRSIERAFGETKQAAHDAKVQLSESELEKALEKATFKPSWQKWSGDNHIAWLAVNEEEQRVFVHSPSFSRETPPARITVRLGNCDVETKWVDVAFDGSRVWYGILDNRPAFALHKMCTLISPAPG